MATVEFEPQGSPLTVIVAGEEFTAETGSVDVLDGLDEWGRKVQATAKQPKKGSKIYRQWFDELGVYYAKLFGAEQSKRIVAILHGNIVDEIRLMAAISQAINDDGAAADIVRITADMTGPDE